MKCLGEDLEERLLQALVQYFYARRQLGEQGGAAVLGALRKRLHLFEQKIETFRRNVYGDSGKKRLWWGFPLIPVIKGPNEQAGARRTPLCRFLPLFADPLPADSHGIVQDVILGSAPFRFTVWVILPVTVPNQDFICWPGILGSGFT